MTFRVSLMMAFVVYQAVYFFNPDGRWWGSLVPGISYSYYIVVFMVLLFIFNFGKLNQNKILKAPPLKWAWIVLGLWALSYFYAVLPEAHLRFLDFYFKLLVIISVAYKLCQNRQDLNYVLLGYVFSAWYVSFYIFQVGRNVGNRVEGIGLVDSPDANGIAAAIAPSIVLCLYYFWISKNKTFKLVLALAGAFLANSIVLINSRGAMLSVAAGIMFFMYHMFTSSFQRKYQKMTAVLITVAGLSGAVYILDESAINRIIGISGEIAEKEERQTGATRTLFWLAAWEMTKDHPLGSGYKGFNYYAPYYLPQDLDTGGSRHRTVHSTWFEVLTEIGYLGLVCFLMMLYATWNSLNKAKEYLKNTEDVDEYFKMIAIQSAMISFMIAMTFLNRMRAEILHWIIMYSAMAYNIYILKESKESKVNP